MTFPSREDTSLSAWAHAYAERGWPVFPLIPRDKRPATRTGFKEATTDHDLIDLWWTSKPDANIGLATGHAFDVLDVDGEAGVQFLRQFWAERKVTYRHTGPTSLTGKGWHMLFNLTGSGNGANLGGDGETKTKVDFRGIGGYIVAPPSIHPLGHHYQWAPNRGPDLPCPLPPDWLRDLLVYAPAPAQTPLRPVPMAHKLLEALAEEQAMPLDQLPRGYRKRFERPDILDIANTKGLQLRKRGSYYVTRCPFHKDDTPSFVLYPANNTFYCYGCQLFGDSQNLKERLTT